MVTFDSVGVLPKQALVAFASAGTESLANFPACVEGESSSVPAHH